MPRELGPAFDVAFDVAVPELLSISQKVYGVRADAATATRLRHARALRHTHGSWSSSAGITTPALSSGFYGAVCRGGDSAPRLRLGPGRGGSQSLCRGRWAKAADPDVAAAGATAADPDVAAAGAKAAALRAVAAGAKAPAHAADGAQAASLGGCCRGSGPLHVVLVYVD